MAGLHYDAGGLPSEKLPLAHAAELAAQGVIQLMTMVWTDDEAASMGQWMPLRECTAQFPEVVARAKEYAAKLAADHVERVQETAGPEEAVAVDVNGSELVAGNEYTIEHADSGLFLQQATGASNVCCVPAAARSNSGLWTLEKTGEEGYFGLRNGQSGAYLDVLDGAAVQYGACTIHVRGIPKEYESDEALRSVFAEFGLYLQGTVRQRSDTVVDGRVVAALSWGLVTFSDQAAVDRALSAKLVTAGGKILGLARVDAEKAMTSTGSFGKVWRIGRHKATAEIDRLYGGGDGQHEARGLPGAALSQWRSADSQVRAGSVDGSQAGAQWAFETGTGLSIWNRKAAQCLGTTALRAGEFALTLEGDSSVSSTKYVLRRSQTAASKQAQAPQMDVTQSTSSAIDAAIAAAMTELAPGTAATVPEHGRDLQAEMSPQTSSALDAAIAAAMGELAPDTQFTLQADTDKGSANAGAGSTSSVPFVEREELVDETSPTSLGVDTKLHATPQPAKTDTHEMPIFTKFEAETGLAEPSASPVFTIEHADSGLFLQQATGAGDVCCVPAAARSNSGLWTLEKTGEEGYFGLRNGQSGAYLDVLDGAAVQYGACTIHVRGIPKEYESDEALRSVFAEFGLYLQGTVRQRSDTVVDGRVVAALSWGLVTFSDQAAVDRALKSKIVAGEHVMSAARVDAEKAMTSTGAFGRIWRESKRKVEREVARLYGGDGEHEARGLSEQALSQWLSADSQVRVGNNDLSHAGAHWAFEPEFSGLANADGLALWNRKAALCLRTEADTRTTGEIGMRLSADSTDCKTKWNLRKPIAQAVDTEAISGDVTVSVPELAEDELDELDAERLTARESEMKAALLDLQRTGSSEAAAKVALHYQRMIQLAEHHGQRANYIDSKREQLARDALQIKREATRQAEFLARQLKAEQEKTQQLADSFDASWTMFLQNQKDLSSKRIRQRKQRRDMKEVIDAWRNAAVESLLEENADTLERVREEAEYKVSEIQAEHQRAMTITQRTNSDTLSELEQQKKQLEEEHMRKVLSAEEETQLARKLLQQLQATKAQQVEEQALIRTRALESRVQAEIARLSKEQMAEYARLHRATTEARSGTYEMRSSSYPVDLSSIDTSAHRSRSYSPRQSSSTPGPARAHSEHLLLSKREGKSHAEYLAGLEERLNEEAEAASPQHRSHYKTLKGRREVLKDFVEEAIAHHVPNPQSGRQRRRRMMQAAGGCCASQRVREGVPPTSSPQMDLAYDAVKPPPTWSCSSRPPRHRAPSAGHGADRTSSPHRNVVTAGDPSARRRGGGRSFGLCGSRPHQAQQESKSTSQGRSRETLLEDSQASSIGAADMFDAIVDPESARWNEKSRAARAKVSRTEHKIGSQEWYRSQREAESRFIQEASEDLPEGWEALLSHSHKGALYYRNIYSEDTTWVRPTEPATKAEKAADADSHKCTVHVGGLEQFRSEHRVREYEEELEEEFSQFGEVLQVKVRIRRRTHDDGSVKVSWALVTFLNSSMARAAVEGVETLERKYPGIVVKIVDESLAKQSKGAMGLVLEKAKVSEQEKLKSMLESFDQEEASVPNKTSSAIRFGETFYAK